MYIQPQEMPKSMRHEHPVNARFTQGIHRALHKAKLQQLLKQQPTR
jgi:hypothetical protein